jgi:acyl carrier protein
MTTHERILELIYQAIADTNRSLEPERALQARPDALLIGDGALDSVVFLNLMVAIEEAVERVFGKAVSVTEAALIGDLSDLLTVGELARRIERLLQPVPVL